MKTERGLHPVLDLLPQELIRHVCSFADIPSLGAMVQTGRNLAAVEAAGNCIWADLVRRRFRVVTERRVPKFHGGRTWKEAYRSMARCNRLFKSRYTSTRKVVFAKNDHKSNSVENPAVSLWVLLGHTENCQTRYLDGYENRFIELCLCLQNVSSSFGTVQVDVMDATLRVMTSQEDGIRRVHPDGRFRPKLRLLDNNIETSLVDGDVDLEQGIALAPFGVAVVSVYFPCAPDIFETDFLAKAISLHIPARWVGPRSDDSMRIGGKQGKSTFQVSAPFLPESDVWNYYSELPGRCLTLTDQSLLVAA